MNTTTGTLDLEAGTEQQCVRVEPLWRSNDLQPLCTRELEYDAAAAPALDAVGVDQSCVRLAFRRLCETRGLQQPSARLLRVWGTD